MKTSFDEIRKIAFRALDGCGAPPGIDEDAGWACAWLEAAGYPGLSMLAELLDEGRADLADGLEYRDDEDIDAGGRSAVCLAPLLVEFAAANGGGLTVRNLRHSPYLIAHAARLAECGTLLEIEPLPQEAGDITIHHGTGDYSDDRGRVTAAVHHGLDVDTQAFERVYAYSRAILVPQSETSLLTGAGAGLTDND